MYDVRWKMSDVVVSAGVSVGFSVGVSVGKWLCNLLILRLSVGSVGTFQQTVIHVDGTVGEGG